MSENPQPQKVVYGCYRVAMFVLLCHLVDAAPGQVFSCSICNEAYICYSIPFSFGILKVAKQGNMKIRI